MVLHTNFCIMKFSIQMQGRKKQDEEIYHSKDFSSSHCRILWFLKWVHILIQSPQASSTASSLLIIVGASMYRYFSSIFIVVGPFTLSLDSASLDSRCAAAASLSFLRATWCKSMVLEHGPHKQKYLVKQQNNHYTTAKVGAKIPSE